MTPTLAVYLFGHNLSKIVYPFLASIESALDLVGDRGAVFYAECDSDPDDSAWEQICELRRKHPNLHLLKHAWADNYYTPKEIKDHGYRIQAVICNYLLDSIGLDYDYAIKLDADEVLHDATFTVFRNQLENMDGVGMLLAKPRYVHFCPDDKTTIPFIYDTKCTISKTSSFFRFDLGRGGDACALGGAPEYQTDLVIHHLGKMSMGREREALFKERDFTKLYLDCGFPDRRVEAQVKQGYIDYLKVFEETNSSGEFKPFVGVHPKYVVSWLAEQRKRHEAFKKELGL